MGQQKVLVVDDEVGFLTIMETLLPRMGFEVLTTTHGQEGLDMIYQYRPDLALLDDMLPGMSGCDICLSVKKDPAIASTPVILYSAGPRVRDHNLMEKIGVDAVLYKPFKPADVVKTIQQCLTGAAV